MSGINRLTSIGTEDPEYYTELLRENPGLTSWRLPSDGPSCSDVPGIRNVYDHALRVTLSFALTRPTDHHSHPVGLAPTYLFYLLYELQPLHWRVPYYTS